MWNVITDPCPNTNDSIDKPSLTGNYILHFYMDIIDYQVQPSHSHVDGLANSG